MIKNKRLFKDLALPAGNGCLRGRFPEIPKTEPEQLSFLVTAAFNLDNELKYQMLEITSTTSRLEKLRDILNQAVDKMEESADIFKVAQKNGHSRKKIEL